ncbi:glycosyltransferase, partial [Mycobacterium tuberculosis]
VLPLVSVIIPTRNALQLTRQCVESILRKTSYSNYEIIIVDNGSDDPDVLAWFKRIAAEKPNVRVLRDDRDFNYAALNNGAVAIANGELVALVN